MVQAFAIVPNGAWPGSCWPLYEIDYPAVEEYMDTQGDRSTAHMAKAPEAKEAPMPELVAASPSSSPTSRASSGPARSPSAA